MDNVKETVVPGANVGDDRVTQHLRALTEEAEALLKATARAGDDKVAATRERLRTEVAHLRQRLGELEEVAGVRLRTAAHRTDEAIHDHPYTAMSAAALVGLLVGMLVVRR
jgi:ElaB/YqjD/DUF883 family membrane-anchored ribosome-binding protein